MITATFCKKGFEVYLIWTYSYESERKILRQLLRDTNTRTQHPYHFVTKIKNQLPQGQTSIDCWSSTTFFNEKSYEKKEKNPIFFSHSI